jgi:beta-glucosidase
MRKTVATAALGDIIQTRIPLRCFSAKGANLASVGSAIRIQANKGLVASLRSIHVEAGTKGEICPDETR